MNSPFCLTWGQPDIILWQGSRIRFSENRITEGYLYSLILDGFSAYVQKDGFGNFEVSYPEVTAEKVQMPDFAQMRKADESNE